MKGGNSYRLIGRQLSLTLIIAVFSLFIFLLVWEKNPLVAPFLSVQDQLAMSTSDFTLNGPGDHTVVISRDHMKEGYFSFAKEEITNDETLQDIDVVQMNSTDEIYSKRNDNDNDLMPSLEDKVCNYAKGRWVPDNRHPLYSGLECKQWLSSMWACRMTERKDFSFEKFKWKPENCEIPEFEGPAFLKRMQDKTLAFVGDSLGRQQFQSLMCMVTGGKEHLEVEDIGKEYNLIKAPGSARPDGWAYRFPSTNTTILYYWSASLCDITPIPNSNNNAMHLDRPPAFLIRFLNQLDVLILNTGHHWNRGKINANRWVMYVNGKPNEDKKLAQIANAKDYAIHRVTKWVDLQLPSHPRLKAFFTTISPRHFMNGDWNTGGKCDNTVPLSRGSEVLNDKSSDPSVEDAVKGTNVKMLDITAISEQRDEGHISHYGAPGVNDCLHWCLPGIPDMWNELVSAQI